MSFHFFFTFKLNFDRISYENIFPMSDIRYMPLESIWQRYKMKVSKLLPNRCQINLTVQAFFTSFS